MFLKCFLVVGDGSVKIFVSCVTIADLRKNLSVALGAFEGEFVFLSKGKTGLTEVRFDEVTHKFADRVESCRATPNAGIREGGTEVREWIGMLRACRGNQMIYWCRTAIEGNNVSLRIQQKSGRKRKGLVLRNDAIGDELKLMKKIRMSSLMRERDRVFF